MKFRKIELIQLSGIGQVTDDPDTEALRVLDAREAVPPWFRETRGWAEEYHRSLTAAPGYTEADRRIRQDSRIAGLELSATGEAIAMPANIPAFLRGLLDSVNLAVIRTGKADDPVRLSWPGLQEAGRRLAQIVGSIREVNMPMFPVPADPWNPGVIAASHFSYLHEFVHIKLDHRSRRSTPDERWSNEFQADEMAFALYGLSLRSYPELEETFAFLGPVLALYFGEIVEFALDLKPEEVRTTHPPIRSRVMAIRDKVRVAAREGLFKTNPLPMGDFFCRIIDGLLLMVSSVGYPIVSPVEMALRTLVSDVKNGLPDRLRASSNCMLQWYFLADWQRLNLACSRALRT
jgi:hypothetical protein